MPQILGIISTIYTGPERAKAFTAYAMAIGFGAVFGQLIGGVLIRLDVAGLGWRTIFLINVPIGVAAALLAPRVVPESKAPGAARIDLVGTVLLSLGLVAIVLPLVEGQQQGWPAWTFGCLAASVPLLGRVRSLPGPARREERIPADQPGTVPGAGIQRRSDHQPDLPADDGVVLPAASALPARWPWACRRCSPG